MKRPPVHNLHDARAMARHARTFRDAPTEQLETADTRYSVLYCLVIIGEVLNDIPSDVQSLAPDIKWRQIIDMRHILVHAHWRTDYTIVQDVIQRDLEPLIAAIDRLLAILSKSKA